ncbi:glycosyltransferase [Limnoraphis robusta]|uniref:Glycosyltransferase n=1 Tax=Limnoraphis robusta CCNP1315 TaxID=3110306 RepID=A0ABU5U356_9CYAN|nr:glycosyltransferase [Limnoraphis robusta]MEA5521500.1 glycosyltransferase [Limnoraphis robusta CCNP1315]MEA5543956.1 glycosyltransferase [Limnoraphis robusta CCNP1324]
MDFLNQAHFLLIFPNIFGFKGGIQVYSAFLLQGLQQLYPDARYDVFLKYDQPTPQSSLFLPQTHFHCFGQFPRLLQTLLMAVQMIWVGIWQRPSLLITTHINYSIPCYWLYRLIGIPYWIVAHGDEVWNLQHPLYQKALRQANLVITVSHYTRDRLLTEQSLRPTQVKVLANTFQATRFDIAPKPPNLLKRYGLTADQPVILTVSRLGLTAAPYKGYYQVLQALVQVRRQIPNVHYFLVGKGDARPEIESLITQLSLTDCVTLTGFVPDEQLNDYYHLCDVFALPSQIEGFGIVYLEALACGKPVLAGNQDGAVDPLWGGDLGCLVDPEDVNAIAENLIKILQGSYPNSNLYQPHLLREKTIKRFAFDQFCANLAQLLQ